MEIDRILKANKDVKKIDRGNKGKKKEEYNIEVLSRFNNVGINNYRSKKYKRI